MRRAYLNDVRVKQAFDSGKYLLCVVQRTSVLVHLCGFFCLDVQKVFSSDSSASTIYAETWPLLLGSSCQCRNTSHS